ncbi:MAG: GNAT family N-acetyltransferase [Bryobacteraceae bacterium]
MTPDLFAISRRIAQRIENAEAAVSLACVRYVLQRDPLSPVTMREIGGGVAIFFGAGSPLTQALGVGLRGPVGAEELDQLEHFFFSRGAAATVSLCPMADAGLALALEQRGFRLDHFEHTLLGWLWSAPVAAGPRDAVRVGPQEHTEWARMVVAGFESDDPELVDLVRVFAASEGARPYWARREGQPAGGGVSRIEDGIAMFYCGSTVPEFRGRGVQTAVIRRRIEDAVRAGCDFAVACVAPDSQSHRNYERAGFRVAYTKALFVKELPDAANSG